MGRKPILLKKIEAKTFKEEFKVTENALLAKKYGVSESYIRTLAARYKVKKAGWEWKSKEVVFLMGNYNQPDGLTINEIAKKLGRTRYAVINKYRELSNKRSAVKLKNKKPT